MILSVLRRYRQPLFVSVVAVFLIGIFVGLGGYFFTGADKSDAVASVGGRDIPYERYRSKVNLYLEALNKDKPEAEISDAQRNEVRQGMLRDMIVDELLAGEAERMGMRISDMELSLSLRNTPAFQREGRFDQELYFQAVRYSFRTSPEQFEREQRRMMLSAKLKAVIARSAKVTPGEIREEYARVNASGKDFEKKKEEFSQALRQRRAVEGINAFLRQLAGKEEIRSFLEQREQGG